MSRTFIKAALAICVATQAFALSSSSASECTPSYHYQDHGACWGAGVVTPVMLEAKSATENHDVWMRTHNSAPAARDQHSYNYAVLDTPAYEGELGLQVQRYAYNGQLDGPIVVAFWAEGTRFERGVCAWYENGEIRQVGPCW